MPEQCVVLLAGPGPSTNMVFHGLRTGLPGDVHLVSVLEQPVSRRVLLRRRVRRLGVLEVTGQLLFMATILPLLRMRSGRRLEEIKREHGLDDGPIGTVLHHVPSVNSPEAVELLQELDPDVIIVNGTRIIGRKTLESINVPIINTHAGITPAYRGVHGGYWALAEGRPDLVGTTVHRIDEGIDTGAIIDQVTFPVTPSDSFVTYPFLHTAAGLPILLNAVRAALKGEVANRDPDPSLPSALRYHPTLWGYVRNYVKHRAR